MADNTNEFKISLGVELESNAGSGINSQIKNLKINTVPIKINLDQTSVKNVQHQIDGIRQQIQALGNIRIDFGGGNNQRGIGSTTSALEKARRDTHNLYKQITSMDMKVAKLEMSGVDAGNIKKYNQQLFNLESTYRSLLNTLSSGGNIDLDKVFASIDKAKTELAELSSEAANAMKNRASDINLKLDNGTFKKQVDKVGASLQKIKVQTNETIDAYNRLNDAFNAMQTAKANKDIDALVDSHREFEDALKAVNNQIKINANSEKLNLGFEKQAFKDRIDIWLKDNSAAAKQFGKELENIKSRVDSCNKAQLDGLEDEFDAVIRKAKLAEKNTKTFGDKIKDKLTEHGIYLSAALMFSSAARALESMYDNVVKIDSAMTDLMKVTDETDASYQRFLNNAGKKAQELGRSVSSFIQQSANWAKMGFDTVESAELAKISSIYANVADVDDATAVSDIVTAMKAFNIEAENAISIIDPMNKISNEFAVTAAGLGQGLSRAASTMSTAGTDMEHTLALLTGIAEITQSPEEAGNFLKTAIARIQGMKGTLEELGEEVDESVDSISKVQTQILNLTHGKVNIFDDNGEFRDYYYIMQDIASIVDELKSTERAQLYEILFGKNRMNQGAAMIQAFQSGRIGEALDAATDAAGSAMAEQEKWLESIEAKLGQLEAAWQSLSQTVINSDLAKGGIDFLTGIVNLLDQIIGFTGSFGAVGAGVAIVNVIKAANKTKSISTLISLLNSAGWSFTNLKGVAILAGQSLKSFAKTPAGAASAIGLVVAAISTAVTAYRNFEAEQERARQETLDTNNEFLDSVDAFEQAYVKYSGKTSLTAEEENDLKSAIDGTVTALGDKNIALQNATKESNNYLKSLQDITAEELKQSQLKATENLYAAEESLQGSAWGLTGSKITINLGNSKSSDKINKSREIVESLMGDYVDSKVHSTGHGTGTVTHQIEPINWDIAHDDMDAVVDYYYQLVDVKNALLEESLNDEDFLKDNDVYDEVKSTIDSLSGSVDEYLTQQYNLAKYNYEIANGIPTTVEEYYAMRDAILANINASEEYKNAIGDIADAEWGKIFDLTPVEKTAKTLQEKIAAIVQAFVKSAKYTEDQALPFGNWLNSLGEDEKEIVYKISLKYDTSQWNGADWINAFNDFSDFTKEQQEKVKESFQDNSIVEWFNSLSKSQKELVYQIGVESDDTTLWTLTRWQKEMDYLIEHGNTATASMESFYDVMNNSEEGNFSEKIKSYTSTMDSLNEALEKITAGTLTNDDKLALAMDFPELAYVINDTNLLQQAIQSLINTTEIGINEEFDNQIAKLGGEETAAGQALLALQNMMNSAVSSDFDIEKEIDRFNDLYTAISESTSATGLSAESIANLKTMYADLDGYDPSKLFERTENGIHLNERALKDLQEEYENTIAKNFKKELEGLKSEYETAARELENLEAGTEEYDKTLNKMKGINDQIQDVQNLMSQYDGLTSAYNKWINAQSADKERDSYENIGSQYDEMKTLVEQGWFGDEELNAYLDLLLGVENRTGSVAEQFEKLGKTIDGTNHSLLDYWKYDEDNNLVTDGLFDFLDDVAKFNSEYAGVGEDGKYWFDFSGDNIDEIAKKFGTTTEMIQLFERALIDTGAVVDMGINYDNIDYSEELKKAEEASKNAKDRLKEFINEAASADGQSVDIDVKLLDYDITTMNLEEISNKITELENARATIDVDTEEGAAAVALINGEIENLKSAKVTLSISAAIEGGSTVEKLLGMSDEELATTLNIDTTVDKTSLDIAKQQLESLKTTAEDTSVTVKIDESQFNALTATDKTVNLTVNIVGDEDVTTLQTTIDDLDGKTVIVSVDTTDGEANVVTLQTEIDGVNDKTVTLSVNDDELINYIVTDKEGKVIYLPDGTKLDEYIVYDKEGEVIYLPNGDKLDEYIVLDKDGNVVYTPDPTKINEYTITDKEGKVVYSPDETKLDGYVVASKDGTVVYMPDGKKLDEYTVGNKDGTVVYSVYDQEVEDYQEEKHEASATMLWGNNPNDVDKYIGDYHGTKGTVEWGNDVENVKTHFTATGTIKWEHGGGGDGGGFVNGTAYARGNWGTKDSGIALGGELGKETIVRDGRFFTIGDNGAEFFHYKKDDIIFNHKQTEQLFKYGKVVSGGGRGRVYANGTANTSGKAFAIGTNKVVVSVYDDVGGGSSRRENDGKSTSSLGSNSSSTDTKKKSNSKSSSSEKDFKETFDWIEVAIDRVERAISNLDLKASSVYRSWSSRNKNLKKEISKVGEEISIQQAGYDRYLQEANSVGLSESWAKLVREGKVDIGTIKDEKVLEKIEEYQEW